MHLCPGGVLTLTRLTPARPFRVDEAAAAADAARPGDVGGVARRVGVAAGRCGAALAAALGK